MERSVSCALGPAERKVAMKGFVGRIGLFCALVLHASMASAQCIMVLTPKMVEEAKSIDARWPGTAAFIFSGVVTEMGAASYGARITFDVDGVWKGTLPQKAVFFRLAHRSEEHTSELQ